MDIELIDPELRGPVRRLPPLPIGNRLVLRLVRAASARIPAARADGVRVRDVADAPVPLRLYRPVADAVPAALYWVHGGGYVLGNPRMDDARCVALARTLGITVVSVDYRLAPEHPFPTPLDDCLAGWTWLHRNAAELGVDPARVALGGASAGGGLAACLVQRLHAEGGPAPAAQWLDSPMLDDRTAARRDLDAVKHRVWDNRRNATGWRAYLGGEPGAPTAPAFSVAARAADLAGLPPTWIGVGSVDLFHDEDLAYAERLRAAGVEVTADVVPGAPHGFDSWARRTGVTRRFHARADDWLAAALGVPRG
ncbi:alpha/beta hydrolase [Saccharothrix yanglingensis]|uniref:Esterase n=1 Tax=Saccharothrix yanglingensis TaxID=659496 RepID=A0ABU0WYX8_9PSEU|nr:alpha/beta hydrolase [Saccharothrix yanglingensis]MDQ2585006.1 esterase [Saccharothrix yanglingensis]